MSETGGPDDGPGGGARVPPRLVVLAGRKGRPSLLPFVAVLLVLATVGLVGLLLLNTALNKGAFTLRQRQAEATRLTQRSEQAQQSLAELAEPGALASRASELGMVPGGNPAFLDPTAGTVLGSPSAAPSPVVVAPSGSVSSSVSGSASSPSGTGTPSGSSPAGGTSSASGAPAHAAPGQLPVPTVPTTPRPTTPQPTTPQPSGSAPIERGRD